MSLPPKHWVIIPAAGIGQRMQSPIPKQYLKLGKKSVIEHTLDVFIKTPEIHRIIVALHSNDPYWATLDFSHTSKIETTQGGKQRADSVLHALRLIVCDAAPDDWVLVHDAVRPCLTPNVLRYLLTELQESAIGGLLGIPVSDTLKWVDNDNMVTTTVSREHLWCAQTPQMFRFHLLYDALQKVCEEKVAITDDASAIEWLGYQPKMVFGCSKNLKITHPSDLALAQYFIEE